MRRALWFLLLVAFGCFAYPMYVIRPFRAQGATELAVALSFRSWGPWLALACAALSLLILTILWRRPGKRIAASIVSGFTILFAALAQVNVYELMFHPAPNPGFIAADKAKVDGDDMVLTVAISGQARAYPIRTMGYHHIINDWVGGTPIVATY